MENTKEIESNENTENAAIIIQNAWRQHIDKQVYRYYRDLINFCLTGDPKTMLKSINPREAELIDAASGIHIKYRLAGTKFPPNIYYKIFTHRPVEDLCANSPKDYSKTRQKLARHVNNKSTSSVETTNNDVKSQWYQRYDNNGWRMVSDRLISYLIVDPIGLESGKRKSNMFHHNRLIRQQEVNKRKKQRKLEWLQKIYNINLLKPREDLLLDEGAVNTQKTSSSPTKADNIKDYRATSSKDLIAQATRGIISVINEQGEEAVEDWEVDELLAWTTGLNYDEYVNDWKKLATSAPSDAYATRK